MIMSKLDQIQEHSSKSKKSKGMSAAVEATEEIRRWVSKIYFFITLQITGGTCLDS